METVTQCLPFLTEDVQSKIIRRFFTKIKNKVSVKITQDVCAEELRSNLIVLRDLYENMHEGALVRNKNLKHAADVTLEFEEADKLLRRRCPKMSRYDVM